MKRLTLLWLSIALLSGCGEFAYKRGASAQDLENAKKTCQSSAEQDTEKCLNAHGWVVKKLDGVEFIHDETPTESNTAKTEQTTQALATNVENKPLTNTAQTNTPPPVTPTEKRDPFETFKISSWWKTGGNDVKFQADIGLCKAQLGAPHTPDMAKQRYSRAFITCMYDHGWKALGKAK